MWRISYLLALILCAASFATAQTVDHPLAVGGDVKPPKLINRVNADAPRNSGHGVEHGEVTLSTVIDEHGHVVKAEVETPSGSPEFDKNAIAAARSFLFSPATQDGKPVAVSMPMTMNFTSGLRKP